MKKIHIVFISLLALVLLPTNLPAAQKAQKTITSHTYDKNFGVTLSVPNAGSTVTTTNEDGSSAMATVATTTPSATVDTSSGSITLINSETNSSGAVWYAGTTPTSSSTPICNPCSDGVCPFGLGFRAYFEFKTSYDDTSARSDVAGDGFTFTVMNSNNNTTSDRGGVPSNSSMGALLGYAGPGDTTSGIEPPKFAIEFDLYPNNTTETNVCNSGRYDNAGSYTTSGSSGDTSNHLSLMFWGNTLTSNCTVGGTSYSRTSFDDNYHGAGGGTTSNPYNSSLSGNGSGLGGYYQRSRSENGGTYNWMEDGNIPKIWHRVRVEVIRDSSAYTYRVKTWVDCENTSGSSTCPATEYASFQDLYSAYSNSSYLPKIDRTVTLSSTVSGYLNNILFGFTEGSGLVTQSITIANFAIYFPTTSIACVTGTNYTCTTDPIGASHTYSTGTGTITVKTAASTCAWTAQVKSSDTGWLSITSGASGTGSGTVTYSVTDNAGAARTGTITIGSETFTVTQAAGPPSCTLVAGSMIIPYNSTNTLTWTVSGTPTSASWTSSPGGTCGSPSTSGGTCTTAAQTTAGARTYTLNVSNANGTSSCSATFYVSCRDYTVYNNTGSRRDFMITNSSCSRTNNGSAISGTLNTGETVTRYATSNRSCGSAQGSFGYTDAMNADIAANGGDGDCQVYYNSSDTATDR